MFTSTFWLVLIGTTLCRIRTKRRRKVLSRHIFLDECRLGKVSWSHRLPWCHCQVGFKCKFHLRFIMHQITEKWQLVRTIRFDVEYSFLEMAALLVLRHGAPRCRLKWHRQPYVSIIRLKMKWQPNLHNNLGCVLTQKCNQRERGSWNQIPIRAYSDSRTWCNVLKKGKLQLFCQTSCTFLSKKRGFDPFTLSCPYWMLFILWLNQLLPTYGNSDHFIIANCHYY